MGEEPKNLSDTWQAAIFGAAVVIAIAIIGGLFGLFKWLFRKKVNPKSSVNTIHQEGAGHTAANIDGDKNIIAGGNVNTGIDSDAALNTLVKTSKELGRTEEENIRLRKTVKELEEELSQRPILAESGTPQVPQPTQEAKKLTALIEEDAGPYALALKAIADGNTNEANELLDKTQILLDQVQQQKERAQAKVYLARLQNASYTVSPQDALPYCAKLKPLADDDSLILNEIATVYYENAKYKDAEPLYRRALKIDEKSFGPNHPNVATDLNNLALLLQTTNRLDEAEPLMKRVIEIFEKSYGKEHPNVATALNNLAELLRVTNRLTEAEPLYRRALSIDEKSFGPDHPNVAIHLNNLALLLKATNRLDDAEPLMERHLVIFLRFTCQTGHPHPRLQAAINNYTDLLTQMGLSKDHITARLQSLDPEFFPAAKNQNKDKR